MLTLSVILAALASAAVVTHVLIPAWDREAQRRPGGSHARRVRGIGRRDGFAR